MQNRPNEREAIMNLQRYLRQLSYTDPDIIKVPIDGIFESDTRQALSAFQRKNGLPQTGNADIMTWNMLFRKYREELERTAKPERVSVFPGYPNGYMIAEGDEFFAVLMLQYMLTELAANYDGINKEYENINRSGKYDSFTTAAVKDFQSRHNLEAHGKTDKLTWNRIVNEYNTLFDDIQQ